MGFFESARNKVDEIQKKIENLGSGLNKAEEDLGSEMGLKEAELDLEKLESIEEELGRFEGSLEEELQKLDEDERNVEDDLKNLEQDFNSLRLDMLSVFLEYLKLFNPPDVLTSGSLDGNSADYLNQSDRWSNGQYGDIARELGARAEETRMWSQKIDRVREEFEKTFSEEIELYNSDFREIKFLAEKLFPDVKQEVVEIRKYTEETGELVNREKEIAKELTGGRIEPSEIREMLEKEDSYLNRCVELVKKISEQTRKLEREINQVEDELEDEETEAARFLREVVDELDYIIDELYANKGVAGLAGLYGYIVRPNVGSLADDGRTQDYSSVREAGSWNSSNKRGDRAVKVEDSLRQLYQSVARFANRAEKAEKQLGN